MNVRLMVAALVPPFIDPRRSPRTHRAIAARPCVECLEDRRLPAVTLTSLAVGMNANGTLEAFVSGNDDAQPSNYHIYSSTQINADGVFQGFAALPIASGGVNAQYNAIVVAANDPTQGQAPGALNLYAFNTNGGPLAPVYSTSQRSAGSNWTAWSSLGSPGTDRNAVEMPLAAALDSGHAVEVFIQTLFMNGAVYATVQNPAGSLNYTGFTSTGVKDAGLSFRAVAQNQNGALEAFGVEASGQTYTIYSNTQDAQLVWQGWAPIESNLATGLTAMRVVQNADGTLELFGLTSDASPQIWTAKQTTPGGTWGTVTSLGTPVTTATVTQIEVGRNAFTNQLQVFALASDNNVYTATQSAPNQSTQWSAWSSLGNPANPAVPLQQIAVAQNAVLPGNQGGQLGVFALGGDGNVYEIMQQAAGGNWGQWGSMGAPAGVQNNAAEGNGPKVRMAAHKTSSAGVPPNSRAIAKSSNAASDFVFALLGRHNSAVPGPSANPTRKAVAAASSSTISISSGQGVTTTQPLSPLEQLLSRWP